jgi:valyl-tRNA synthetase
MRKVIDKQAQNQFIAVTKIIAEIRKYKLENRLSIKAELKK